MLKVQEGFEKANSGNLPELSIFAICTFINEININNFETRCVKVDRSSRKEYGDQSVGYVQVRRTDAKVKISGVITPEHKVHAAGYEVSAIIDESRDRVEVAQCFGCAASEGGCKHIVAFLFWINRRSEEPSPTEVTSYWKKSSLAALKSGKKFMSLKEYCGSDYKECLSGPAGFNEKLLETAKKDEAEGMIVSMGNFQILSLHVLAVEYSESHNNIKNAETFRKFAADKMEKNMDSLFKIEKLTRDQSDSKLWHELRYGRITASRLYEVAHCNTGDGSLVNVILGAKTFSSKAMERGKVLEDQVLQVIASEEKVKISKRGILMWARYPTFGASPDGYAQSSSGNFVIEVKCPLSIDTYKNYIKPDGSINPKYLAQMNLQMRFAHVKKALFVVAHPDFEESKKIQKVWVTIDNDFIDNLISKSLSFWDKYIFKFICQD